jgi:hypothetical protein
MDMKYNVGDTVKIKSNLEVGNNADKLYINTDMINYKGKSAHITYAYDGGDGDEMYNIDIDDDGYYWSNDCFEDEVDSRCKYIIGYKKAENGSVRTFEGYIDNFYPTGKSCFINDNDEILLLPYNLIEYIIPKKE